MQSFNFFFFFFFFFLVKTKNAKVIYVRNQMGFLNGQNEWYKIQMDYASFL